MKEIKYIFNLNFESKFISLNRCKNYKIAYTQFSSKTCFSDQNIFLKIIK